MMQDMTHRHEYNNLMRDIPIYDGKNKDLADWLQQSEKASLLTNNQEYELATAKLTSRDRIWQDIKKKTEVDSPIATEVHTARNLHRKQRSDEILQKRPWVLTWLTSQIE